MTGKRIPCVLCQHEAAAFYCVNDDAHLCGSCDASVHGANPLLARHERRPLSALACQAHECASAAPSSGPCASHSTDGDAGVVPEAPQAPCAASVLPPLEPAGPMDLYEDCFLGRRCALTYRLLPPPPLLRRTQHAGRSFCARWARRPHVSRV